MCTYRTFVVELVTFLLVSILHVMSRYVFKDNSWSTRIFLINDEFSRGIMGCFSKCRWCGESQEEMFKVNKMLILTLFAKKMMKKGFVFFLQKVLFFFWFGVKYEQQFLWDQPNRSWSFGTVVTDVLTHWLMFYWKLALDCYQFISV